MTKKSLQIFFRSIIISSLLVFCPIIIFYGIATAYEGIRSVGFAEDVGAVGIIHDADGNLCFKFFDSNTTFNFTRIITDGIYDVVNFLSYIINIINEFLANFIVEVLSLF